jgi:hypothetical protein
MRSKRNIRLALLISMIIALALIIPCLSIAGSLEPPSYAVDGSGNPIPTMHSKTACRGEFWNNKNGTVTDCKTGLIWMQNANCFGTKTWSQALDSCSNLASDSCGLLDGSTAGDWHLPTIEELKTLPDMNYFNPVLSNAKGDGQWSSGDAFNNVETSNYWSSTTNAYGPGGAWYVGFDGGSAGYFGKGYGYVHVWCVRGGQ